MIRRLARPVRRLADLLTPIFYRHPRPGSIQPLSRKDEADLAELRRRRAARSRNLTHDV